MRNEDWDKLVALIHEANVDDSIVSTMKGGTQAEKKQLLEDFGLNFEIADSLREELGKIIADPPPWYIWLK